MVSILAPFTLNLHIKDFTIKRASQKMGFIAEGCPAGAGMLDIRWMLKKLDSYKKCSSATLELWTPPAKKLEETLQKERIWAAESINYLKALFE